jgi:hypothetical protein
MYLFSDLIIIKDNLYLDFLMNLMNLFRNSFNFSYLNLFLFQEFRIDIHQHLINPTN